MSTPSPGPISALPKLPILLVDGSETKVVSPCDQYLKVVVIGMPGDAVHLSEFSFAGGAKVVASGTFDAQGRFQTSLLPPPPCPNIFYLRATDETTKNVSNVVTVYTYLLPFPAL